MTKVKITNGFPNTGGKGNYLTGEMLQGRVEIGDKLIVEEKIKIPIIEVEMLTGITRQETIRISIPRSYDDAMIWHTLYGREFEVENNLK